MTGVFTGANGCPGRDAQRMSTIHPNKTMPSTPEQFVAGLTDFGPGRRELFGDGADDQLKVHRDNGAAGQP
jgi:hypothetical protein